MQNPMLASALEDAEAKITANMLSDEAVILLKDFNTGETPEGLAC